METPREKRIQELRNLIESGDYVVDPSRTAHEVVRCVSALALARADAISPPVVPHQRRRVSGLRVSVRRAARRCRGTKTALATAEVR